MNVSLSLCLIVRDEEVHLERVLKNAVLYTDEIVIVDTGSKDRTKEIAKKYAQKVYDFPWCNDFSAARNFAISKCTKDFIIWLDADDIILDEDAMRIRSLFEQYPLVDIFFFPYYYAYHKNGRSRMVVSRERIFRNNKYISFIYPVHECINSLIDVNCVNVDIPIYHRNINVADDEMQSIQRNLSILLDAVKDGEYEEDMRMWWYLAKEYAAAKHYEKSLEAYYLALTRNNQNLSEQQKSHLYFDLGSLLFKLKKYGEAQEYLETAMKMYPFWREPFFQYASLQFTLKKYNSAINAFLRCKEIMLPENKNVVDLEIYNEKTVNRWLARTYFYMGRIDSAIFYYVNSV